MKIAKSSGTPSSPSTNAGRFLMPYYLLHYALFASYLLLRESSYLDMKLLRSKDAMGIEREQQLVVLLIAALIVKYRRSGTLDEFFPNAFLYAKAALIIALLLSNQRVAVYYMMLCVVLFFAVSQPEYKGESNVVMLDAEAFASLVELEGASAVERKKGAKTTWVVEFYANWAPPCRQFSAHFAALSLKYGHKYLKFGKINIGRYARLADKYNVSLNPVANKEMPTLIVFRDGAPVPDHRLPPKDPQRGVIPVTLSFGGVAKYFDLDGLLDRCQRIDAQPQQQKQQSKKRR